MISLHLERRFEVNRRRKENESFEEYRANLKGEALKEKLKLKPWLLQRYINKYGITIQEKEKKDENTNG